MFLLLLLNTLPNHFLSQLNFRDRIRRYRAPTVEIRCATPIRQLKLILSHLTNLNTILLGLVLCLGRHLNAWGRYRLIKGRYCEADDAPDMHVNQASQAHLVLEELTDEFAEDDLGLGGGLILVYPENGIVYLEFTLKGGGCGLARLLQRHCFDPRQINPHPQNLKTLPNFIPLTLHSRPIKHRCPSPLMLIIHRYSHVAPQHLRGVPSQYLKIFDFLFLDYFFGLSEIPVCRVEGEPTAIGRHRQIHLLLPPRIPHILVNLTQHMHLLKHIFKNCLGHLSDLLLLSTAALPTLHIVLHQTI